MVPYNFLKCLFCICEICRWYFDRDCIETWFLILKTYCMLWPEITQWTTLVTLPSCGWHSSGEGRSKSSTSTEMLHKHYGDHSLHKARGEEGPEGLGCLFARGHKWGSEPYDYLRKNTWHVQGRTKRSMWFACSEQKEGQDMMGSEKAMGPESRWPLAIVKISDFIWI